MRRVSSYNVRIFCGSYHGIREEHMSRASIYNFKLLMARIMEFTKNHVQSIIILRFLIAYIMEFVKNPCAECILRIFVNILILGVSLNICPYPEPRRPKRRYANI